jgi:amidase
METENPRLRIRRPDLSRLRSIAGPLYLSPTDAELKMFERLIDRALDMFDDIDTLPQVDTAPLFPDRLPGRSPAPGEDPLNAFITLCDVRGSRDGPLAGLRVGLKDNIRLAGIRMTNGSTFMSDYIAKTDAVVVERLLLAGARITGKLNMDDFGFAGTSETSAFGVIRNPHNLLFSAGGSSGGCGAAIVSGDVDIAIAVDQGGSGRVPASWCGAAALKPTHGLIPSYGITYLDHTLDFVTPLTRTVAELATVMEVLAGTDPRDPQWVRGAVEPETYTLALDRGVRGMRLGILAEGLCVPNLEDDVAGAFRTSVKKLEALGAEIRQVSCPLWPNARAIWNGFASHAIPAMIESNQEGFSRLGLCDPDWQKAFGDARRTTSDRFPVYMRMLLMLGSYLRDDLGGTYFGKALNLRYEMRRQLDDLFQEVDAILTPTTPMKAFRLLTEPMSVERLGERAGGMCDNTYPLNVTGNPALSIPCGVGENGLPIGLQIIARHFRDATAIKVAHALEQSWAS